MAGAGARDELYGLIPQDMRPIFKATPPLTFSSDSKIYISAGIGLSDAGERLRVVDIVASYGFACRPTGAKP